MALGFFLSPKRGCNLTDISRKLLSIEDNSAGNSIAESPSLATKLRAVVASITRSEGQWPEIGNMEQGGLLISKTGVMKAEKGKTITTLVRGHEVIWGEMDLVRRLLTGGREENRENMGT